MGSMLHLPLKLFIYLPFFTTESNYSGLPKKRGEVANKWEVSQIAKNN